ncbi:MAG: carbohydrate kinase family protein [Ardenticatenaceae bacterium]|nr:carbohydrate kinase family protein [Ardenticatenaceae bacterium]
MSDYILIIGASLMDTKGKPTAGLEPGTSNPAQIRSTRGGTARNVAENLARLGAEVKLITAVGDDETGRLLLEGTAEAGVDLSEALVVDNAHSGSYMAVLDDRGHLSVALDDTSVMVSITPERIHALENLFAEAYLVVFDGGLTAEAIKAVVEMAQKHGKPVVSDPSSTRLAPKLVPYVPHLSLVVPNELEASVICSCEFPGYDPQNSLLMARTLVSKGVKTAVVTLSDFGLVYATSEESGHIPARYNKMVDSTGTGDSITAAIIFGMINDLSTLECMRLGAAAAGLTLQTEDSVVPDLSLDMLYEHLIV